MIINSKKVMVNTLVKGMYVSRLDRPWLETPYPIEGFYIKNEEDIRLLSNLCRFIYIDMDLTKLRVDINQLDIDPHTDFSKQDPQSLTQEQIIHKPHSNSSKSFKKTLKPVQNVYCERIAFEKELKTATKLYDSLCESTSEILKQVSLGKHFDAEHINKTADSMVQSILRNPDAFLWLSRLKTKDSLTHSRSIRAAIWAITFGRYLSLSKEDLTELSVAVLLSSIGKARLPRELIENANKLEGAQLRVYQKHIIYAVKLLKDMGNFSTKVIQTVAAHCERYNGSGYPRKLKQEKIIFLAQIAGLVCYYEEITHQRESQKSLDTARAMEHLYKLRNTQFQAELVEEFIQSIGIYPAGSLIELNSREIAVVVEQNEQQRLLPKVMILRDHQKKPVTTFKILDLSAIKSNNGIVPKIINSVPMNSYAITSEEISKNIHKADKHWLMRKLRG